MLEYDAEKKRLHLRATDGQLVLSLNAPRVLYIEILNQLEELLSDLSYRGDVENAIKTFGRWAEGKEQPPVAEKLLYQEVATAFFQLLRRRRDLKIRLAAEFRAIVARFFYEVEIIQETATNRTICFWDRQTESGEPYLQLTLYRLPKRTEEGGDEEGIAEAGAKEREKCRRSCFQSLHDSLQPGATPGTAEHDRQVRLLHTIRRLPAFFEGINPLSEAGRYLREVCLVLLTLSQQLDILSKEFAEDPDLERKLRMFVVLSEESPGSRHQHLEDLLRWETDYSVRRETLNQAMQELKEAGAAVSDIWQIGVSFAEYYLSVYDFDSAAQVLDDALAYKERDNPQVENSNPGTFVHSLLSKVREMSPRFILLLAKSLFRHARRWALLSLLFVGVLMSPSVAQITRFDRIAETVASAGFAVLYVALISFPAFILWKSSQDKLPYYQLFFPRLFGAIVVGFAILIFEQTAWSMGGKIALFPLLFIGSLAVLAARGYLQIDIHRLFIMARGMDWKRAFAAASRLFWIGLMQALIVATAVISLLSSAVDFDAPVGIKLPFVIPLGLYPTIVLLWTVIALFLGAFLQLFWQSVRVTEPV